MGSKLGDPINGIPKFFSSISFDKTRKSSQVIDGPGEQPTLDSQINQEAPAVLSGRDVTRRARVGSRPEPHYTEEARRHQITGTVVLRAVFSSSGAVTNIHAMSTQPDGLTEMAIEAARKIRFIPAIKDGRFVSMWMELQYNFNLY
jgi:TonB family protein